MVAVPSTTEGAMLNHHVSTVAKSRQNILVFVYSSSTGIKALKRLSPVKGDKVVQGSSVCCKFFPSLLIYVTQNGGSYTDCHQISLVCLKRELFFGLFFLAYQVWMVTVEADDLIAVSLSLCWIPEQLYGWICHHSLSHSVRRSQTWNHKPDPTTFNLIILYTHNENCLWYQTFLKGVCDFI